MPCIIFKNSISIKKDALYECKTLEWDIYVKFIISIESNVIFVNGAFWFCGLPVIRSDYLITVCRLDSKIYLACMYI